MLAVLPFLMLSGMVRGSVLSGYEVSVDVAASKVLRDLPVFWSSTGFSAPSADEAQSYLLSKEMEWNLALIGATPKAAIHQVRVHWLLQLVRAKRLPGEQRWQWNFSCLDRFLDLLESSGLLPGFEIMGNPLVEDEAVPMAKAGDCPMAETNGIMKMQTLRGPHRPLRPRTGGLVTNISEQGVLWTRLVRDTIVHCGERYGREAVSRWRFETWNEPDLAMYNSFNWTVDAYMTYFNATVRGLRRAERALGMSLRLGGPAGTFKSRRRHPICWHVMDHCNRLAALNQSCGLDFFSFHRKGDGTSASVADQTVSLLEEFVGMFPYLRDKPFANDEADPLTGWWRHEEWRGDRRYAGLIVNTIADLQERWRGRGGDCGGACAGRAAHGGGSGPLPPLELLGNDNGFLETTQSHFEQRTLLASFREDNKEWSIQMFRKSVMTAMALLSFMGGAQLPARGASQPSMKTPLRFTTLASLRRLRPAQFESNDSSVPEGAVVSVLVAFNNETHSVDEKSPAANVRLTVSDLPSEMDRTLLVRVVSLDVDPMEVWRTAGSPSSPPDGLRRLMRQAEIPRIEQVLRISPTERDPKGSRIALTLTVPLGSISLVQIFSTPAGTPLRVQNFRALNVTFNEVLLLWSDDKLQSSHATGYRVSFRRGAGLPFTAISEPIERRGHSWMLFPSLHHAPVPVQIPPPGSAPADNAGSMARIASMASMARTRRTYHGVAG